MVRAYTLAELKTVLDNCSDLVECLIVNRSVMLDKEFYSQNQIDIFLRMLDKKVGQLNKKQSL